MALASIYRVVQDVQGNIVTEVLGTITLAGTSTLAALFSDAAGTAPLPNPLVNSATYGSYNVFVGAGSYDMSFLKAGYTFETQRNIVLRDPAAGVNTITGTANQVLVAPAGGVGAVTLSTPQNIDPNAAVQFQRLGLNTTPPTGSLQLHVANDVHIGGVVGIGTTPVPGQGLTVTTSLYLGGLANINGSLAVLGASQLTGPVGINTTPPASPTFLAVGGGAYVAGLMNCGGALSVAGNAAVTGTANISGTAAVGGLLTASADARVNGHLALNTAVSANFFEFRWTKGSANGLVMRPLDADTGNLDVAFLNLAGSLVGSIVTTATTTTYNTTSDRRLKEAITPLAGALDVLRALQPVAFRWKRDGSTGQGFLADEVQQVVPEAVTGEPDAVGEDGAVQPQGVDFSKLVPWLTSAIQALLARVEALEGASAPSA